MDKTQVFTYIDNDNITKRMTHVQMVSRIARTIGRALGLNEDLIEAASLGHDLGHVPFGHVGEKALNDLSLEYGEGYFNHNVQSVRLLMDVEKSGKGRNITVQVLDAILCHNGEIESQEYRPVKKTKEEFLDDYKRTYESKEANLELVPMTLEGCVVRISDIISYIGRDMEDAIKVGILKRSDIPASITKVLGSYNKDIVDVIIRDIVNNSIGKNAIILSDDIYKAVQELKKFDYENIYEITSGKDMVQYYSNIMRKVFVSALDDLRNNNKEANIFKTFLDWKEDIYLNKTSDVRKVIDYIAGMTDDFIFSEYKKIVNNK